MKLRAPQVVVMHARRKLVAIRRPTHHVGRIIDTLKELEIYEDTLIFVMIGDNGASAEGTLQGAFNEMASELEEGEQLRRNLLADVAHELRTPLTVLRGNLRAILDDRGGAYYALWHFLLRENCVAAPLRVRRSNLQALLNPIPSEDSRAERPA